MKKNCLHIQCMIQKNGKTRQKRTDIFWDCLWGELYGSINSAQWDNVITKEQADYLRDKYLGIQKRKCDIQ